MLEINSYKHSYFINLKAAKENSRIESGYFDCSLLLLNMRFDLVAFFFW